MPAIVGGNNTFIPEATGQAIAYVRDPDQFKINRYVEFVKSMKTIGLYAQLDTDIPVRVVSDNDFAWADGDKSPEGRANVGNFDWKEFNCFRRAYPYTIGEEALDQAGGFNARAFFDATVLSQAMTAKTARVCTILDNPASWGANTADVETLAGVAALWKDASGEEGDTNYLLMRKSILAAVNAIHLATNGMVKMKDLMLVISPTLAQKMAVTSEINAFLKQSPFALAQVRGIGGEPGQNAEWGLPDHYVLPVVVEDAVRTSTRPATNFAPAAKSYIKAGDSAAIVTRVGGGEGTYGSKSWSSIQTYYYKYLLSVESQYENWDKRYAARVIDHDSTKLAAPASGFLITEV